MDHELAATLADMAAEDQRARRLPMRELNAFVVRTDPQTAWELRRVDAENAKRLRAILSRYGWPGRSLVGDQGSHDAWLIAQHADHQPDLQWQALELLSDAVAGGEASARDLAYLTDRVRVNHGREQIFGTQIRNVEDEVVIPWPVEDRKHLDRRRAEVGLHPISRYKRDFARRFEKD